MVCELICSYVPSSSGTAGCVQASAAAGGVPVEEHAVPPPLRASLELPRGNAAAWAGRGAAGRPTRERAGGPRAGESRRGRSGGCGLHLVSLVERPIAGHERLRRPKETPRVRSGRRAARRSRRPGCAPPSRRLRRSGLAGVRSPGRDSQRETHGAGGSDRDAPVAGGVSMFQTERGGIDEAGSPG